MICEITENFERGKHARIGRITQFTVLDTTVRIATNSKAIDCRLQDIRVKAQDPIVASRTLTIEVLKKEGAYVVIEEGEVLVSSPDAERITLYLHELINYRISGYMSDLIKVHAASGSLKGKRFLLIGDKGAGKTTLITRLLFEDTAVYGDETVLLQGEAVLPFPRKFHLKEGTLSLVPQLVPICENLMRYPAYYGGRFCFFDPTDAGCDWRITKGQVDALFYLEPRHTERTDIERCPDWLMVQKLLLQASDFASNPEAHIGQLCHLVDASENFICYLGELDRAVLLLKDLLA